MPIMFTPKRVVAIFCSEQVHSLHYVYAKKMFSIHNDVKRTTDRQIDFTTRSTSFLYRIYLIKLKLSAKSLLISKIFYQDRMDQRIATRVIFIKKLSLVNCVCY